MSDPVFSRESMRARGADAFAAGKPRDGHGFNWHAPAIVEWQLGWDDAAALARAERVREDAQAIT